MTVTGRLQIMTCLPLFAQNPWINTVKCNVISQPLGGDNNKIIPFLFLNLHYAQFFFEQLQVQTKRRGKIIIEVMIVFSSSSVLC